jgi:hypothetical protein
MEEDEMHGVFRRIEAAAADCDRAVSTRATAITPCGLANWISTD